MEIASDSIFGSIFESDYFGLYDIGMSNVNDFPSVQTPPYDGSEKEDEQFLDKLLSESAVPESDDYVRSGYADSVDSLLSTCASPTSVCDMRSESPVFAGMEDTNPQLHSAVKECVEDNKRASTRKKVANRNAIHARENRERRKMYIKGLEDSVALLTKENETYKTQIDTLQSTVDALATDAEYLRNVLKNQSDLSKILNAVSTVPDYVQVLQCST